MPNDNLTDVQKRVHRRLRLLGDGPPAFFLDACKLATDPNGLSTATHLIGHLLREVDGNLREVLYSQLVVPQSTVTASPVDEAKLPKANPPGSTPASVAEDSLRSTPRVGPGNAAKTTKDDHGRQVRGLLSALGLQLDGAEAEQWIAMAGGEKGLHRIAHRDNLKSPRPLSDAFLREFDSIVQLFDVVLERFESRYTSVYARLDTLLACAQPRKADVELLVKSIPNTPDTLAYFFARLTHVGWLEPLREAGFFSSASAPQVSEERRSIGFPPWPAAEYLGRAAEACPGIVASILETVDSKENVAAQAQMIEIMLRLTANDRVAFLRTVKLWVPNLLLHHRGDHAASFAAALISDGSLDAAFDLMPSVLGVPEPDPRTGQRPTRTADFRQNERAEVWHLRDGRTPLIHTLVRADGMRALWLFAEVLDWHVGRRSADAEADPTCAEGLADLSGRWADDLENGDAQTSHDIRVFLAETTLNTAREVGRQQPDRIAEVLSPLRTFGARVLRRIELAALSTLVASDEAKVSQPAFSISLERLTERPVVIEPDLANEWGMLLVPTFERATPRERQRILKAIQPPSFSWLHNPEFENQRAAMWRRDRLSLVADQLDPEERRELETLTEQVGDAEPLGYRGSFVTTFTGPASPIQDTELREMRVESLAEFLAQWRPRQGFAEPSPEGLGRQIARLVAERPENYASGARRFIGLEPTYVRSLLDGFANALRAGRFFSWDGVLELAEWVLDQQVPASDMAPVKFDADPDMRGARRTIADLLGLGLAQDSLPQNVGIALAESSRIWRLIKQVAEDINPSPEYEQKYGGSNMDPATLAINTTRPEAIDAAIRYAYWIHEHTERSASESRGALSSSADVSLLLKGHLNPAEDPSLAVRAAIGRWLGTFARLDRAWLGEHINALLPEGDAEAARRNALWDTYVQWTEPHPDVLPVLEPYYRAAIDRTGAERGTRFIGEDPDNRLAEHLMQLYWWGALSLDDPNGLVSHFFEHADSARRRHGIQYVGFSLFHSEKPLPVQPIERLIRLWDWRFSNVRAQLPEESNQSHAAALTAELEEFGWWFASGAFDDRWALEQLRLVLELTGNVDLDHAVAERLAQLSSVHPLLALKCLAAVDLTAGEEPWSVHSWIEHARTVFKNALSSGEPEARDLATAVINRAVAAGHLTFRDLL